jgi:hypothetical protein
MDGLPLSVGARHMRDSEVGMVKAPPPRQKAIIRCFVAGAEQSRLSPLKTHGSTFKLRYCG